MAQLASLYLKLNPARHILLEAWVQPENKVSRNNSPTRLKHRNQKAIDMSSGYSTLAVCSRVCDHHVEARCGAQHLVNIPFVITDWLDASPSYNWLGVLMMAYKAYVRRCVEHAASRRHWIILDPCRYSLTARSDGNKMDLFVNARFEGARYTAGGRFGINARMWNGANVLLMPGCRRCSSLGMANFSAAATLAVPPLPSHGDFTVGCGMFGGKRADPCSCLVSEVRRMLLFQTSVAHVI